jgi:hypothetical protein
MLVVSRILQNAVVLMVAMMSLGVGLAIGAGEAPLAGSVFPLSNGLTFELGPQGILERFGLPLIDETSVGAKLRQVTYRGFSASIEADSGRIVRLDLRGDTSLASEIKIGTPWSIVVKTFLGSIDGDERLEVDLPRYRLTLERVGSVVGAIQIRQVDRAIKRSAPVTVHDGSRIEPLSNGVYFSGSADEVVAKMGTPEQDDRRHPAVRLLIYKSLHLQFENRGQRLNRASILDADVALACGVRVGTPKDVLKRELPSVSEGIVGTPMGYTEAGLVLSFWIEADRVSRIDIRRVSGAGGPSRGDAR